MFRKGEDISLLNQVIGLTQERGFIKKIFFPEAGK